MTDPATDPGHDLVDQPQDSPQPHIRLGTFLALMRVLAGRRGHASIAWHRFGFTYAVSVTREPGADDPPTIDRDPGALGGDEARDRLRDALAP